MVGPNPNKYFRDKEYRHKTRKLSMDNKNHNISNIIWNVQGWKTGMFVGLGETNSPGQMNGGWTGNKYPLYGSLSDQNILGYPHIGDMKILLSLRT